MSDDSLIELLKDNLPKHRRKDGQLCFQKVAAGLGISRQAVQQWKGHVPPNRVNGLIALEGSTLTKEKLLPFVDFG